MSASDLQILFRAESIIQRDAILAALHAEGINAHSPDRAISRKTTANTVDLAYEGYSALFEGFEIQVHESDLVAAKKVVESLLTRARLATEQIDAAADPDSSRSLRKFYFCALFSLGLPGVMHAMAIYHLLQAQKKGEKMSGFYFYGCLLLLLVTGGVVLFIAGIKLSEL